MPRMLTSILMIGTIGYFGYRYRYRLLNSIVGTGWLRRFVVGSVLSMPGVRDKMMATVFGGPANASKPSDW